MKWLRRDNFFGPLNVADPTRIGGLFHNEIRVDFGLSRVVLISGSGEVKVQQKERLS